MSRATGDGSVGRRCVPPLDCGCVSAGTEPRRERPRLPPRTVTPRAAQGRSRLGSACLVQSER